MLNSPLIRNLAFLAVMATHISSSFFFNWPIANIYKSIRYKYDQTYEGIILSKRVDAGTLRSCSRVKISYKYEINNLPYLSSELWNKSTCKNHESSNEFLSLKVNQKVTIYSNEENPNASVLKVITPSIWQWLIASFFIALTCWIIPPALPHSKNI